jgi:hypothetical protein
MMTKSTGHEEKHFMGDGRIGNREDSLQAPGRKFVGKAGANVFSRLYYTTG